MPQSKDILPAPAQGVRPHPDPVDSRGQCDLSRIRTTRLVIAFTVAIVSDALSIFTEFAPPMQWGVDVLTALALFALLGRRWQILPAMVAEAIPGLAVFPFWILVVAAVAVAVAAGQSKRNSGGGSLA
jgi:hypothetical protein